MSVWWLTEAECLSALARGVRRDLRQVERDEARTRLAALAGTWAKLNPTQALRARVEPLVFRRPLRTADACQLAAALAWADDRPGQRGFVCRDRRLRAEAAAEGFIVLL